MNLEILKEAANYVESHQQEGVNKGVDVNRNAMQTSPKTSSPPPRALKENGSADAYSSKKNLESTRVYNNTSDVRPVGNVAHMSQYSRHSNGVLPPVYAEEKHSPDRRSTDSVRRSPERKRPPSPPLTTKSEQQIGNMVLPPPLRTLPTSVTHMSSNDHMPFMHPYLYPVGDAAAYAELLASQGFGSDVLRQGRSPSSSPNGSATSAALQAQAFQRLLNPGLFMTPQAGAPGMGLTDIPMTIPPQVSPYGQAVNLLQPPLTAAYANMSDVEKKFYESMTQPVPAQFLASSYLKNFYPGLDMGSNKEVNRSFGKAVVPGAPIIPGMPNVIAEQFLKYHDALIKGQTKSETPHASASSASKHSSSPDIKKASFTPGHASAHHFQNPYARVPTTLTKSPAADLKPTTPVLRQAKSAEGLQVNYEARNGTLNPRDRESTYDENHSLHMNGDDTRRNASALQQRPPNPLDLYQSRYKSASGRGSPSSPYSDRGDLRRTSREYSPHPSSNIPDKKSRKRSHEPHGLPLDIPRRKSGSPIVQSSVGGMGMPKSPQPIRSRSPDDRQQATFANPFSGLAGKSNLTHSEKEAASYYSAHPPLMFHPATLSGFPSFPLAIPQSFIRPGEAASPSAGKAVADAMAASSFATAPGTQLYRPPITAEVMAEYARYVGLQQYAPVGLLAPQSQQEALRAAAITTASTAVQDYAAALKQAVLPSTLLMDPREKERVASPFAPSARPYVPTPITAASKLARASPNPMSHTKVNTKYPAFLHPQSRSSAGHPGMDGRLMKRELSPSPGKRGNLAAFSPAHSHQKVGPPQTRMSDVEDRSRLKRRSAEDEIDRYPLKDPMMKRKKEMTSGGNANDVDDHFRRSLGEKYTTAEASNKLSITASVDDHFVKSLGSNYQTKLNRSNHSASPEPREIMSSVPRDESQATSAVPPYHNLPTLPVGYDPRFFASLSHTAQPRYSAGVKTVKARGIFNPESMIEAHLSSSSPRTVISGTGQGEITKTSPHRLSDGVSHPPAYESISRVRSDASLDSSASLGRSQSTTPPAVDRNSKISSSPVSTTSHADNNGLCLNLSNSSHLSNNSANRQSIPYSSHPSSLSSNSSKPSLTYSPQSSASGTSIPTSDSPRRSSGEIRQADESGPNAPVSVET